MRIPASRITDAYRKAFYTQLLHAVIRHTPELDGFTRVSQDKAVSLFAEKDTLLFEINKIQIQEKLSSLRPSLDMCAPSMPQSQLLWHYRSRYEQLIAFSNKHFYGGRLMTFPSASGGTEGTGVDYYHVDGVFDRKNHTNRAEAERVAELVFEDIRRYPERSLGVLAFSVAQQNLIDSIITRKRMQDTSFEEFFSREREHPFFVKNLETVQGDERDMIIFSTAYGKDGQGRLVLPCPLCPPCAIFYAGCTDEIYPADYRR